MESRKVLFITTKNLDYIRNCQEIEILKNQYEQVDILGSANRKYIIRIFYVYSRLLLKKLKGYDEVFVGFAPQLIIPVFRWKFRHTRIILDFFISFYDTLVCDRKKFKKDSIAAKILKKLDTDTILSANRIIVDTKAHGEYFCTEFGADIDKIEVLYLEADEKIYYPHIIEKSSKYKNKKIVLYFGSILPLQGIEIIMGAVEFLRNRKDIHFFIIGPIKNATQKRIQDNVTYINWLSQKDLSDYIAMADICLAGHFNADIEKASRTIPGKAYIYRAMKKPMILGDNPANRELFSEEMPGIYFTKMGDIQRLADMIDKAVKNMSQVNGEVPEEESI